MKKSRLPFLAVFCGALALAPLASLEAGHWLQDSVFGEDVPRLSPAEMAAAKGGVGMTVIKPRPSQRHYIDNPRLIADVFNHQNQGRTTLYLHHGTSKTGSRRVPTPAPGYAGRLESRFKHLGGTEDLVIKYFDKADRVLKVTRVVPAQKMDTSVRLLRLVVHNVKTTINETTVAGSVIARAVDSQSANRNLAISDNIDLILSQCPRGRRTQFQLLGKDHGPPLHTINTGTANCASLASVGAGISYAIPPGGTEKQLIFSTAAQNCMQELLNGAEQDDPNHESYHVYIVKDLINTLNGFHSVPAVGAVIKEAEFGRAPSWVASLLLHEVAHGFEIGDLADSNARCQGATAGERALMCEGSLAGTRLSTAECDKLHTVHNTVFLDHN